MAFEISILVRDAQGNVLCDVEGNPKRKLYTAHNGGELNDIWNRNGAHNQKKKGRAAKGKEVKAALGDMEKFAADVTKKKRARHEDIQAEQTGP